MSPSNEYESGLQEDLLTRYALGQLDAAESEEVAKMLRADPAAAEKAKELCQTADLLPYAKMTPPPAHLRQRILRAAARKETSFVRPRWSWALAAAAAIMLIVLGIDDRRLRRELQLQREAADLIVQPNVTLLFDVHGRTGARQAFGRVVLDLDAKRAAVVIRDLPEVSNEEVYRLWAVLEDRTTVRCGEFQPKRGAVSRQIAIPVDAYTSPVRRLILTRERGPAAPRPAGPTVMDSL